MLTSDDHDIQYLLEMGLKSYVEKVLEWNDPRSADYCEEFDQLTNSIITNLCASASFSYGQELIESP